MSNLTKVLQDAEQLIDTLGKFVSDQYWDIHRGDEILDELKRFKEKLESVEPVGWVVERGYENLVNHNNSSTIYPTSLKEAYKLNRAVPLYPHPAPLGELSDEQVGYWLIAEGFDPQDWDYQKMMEFAKAIRSHLTGEK